MTQVPRDTPQFYLTAPTPCPYLPGRQERKVFTHLVGRRARASNDALTKGGFRRSQTIAYRPACEACRACVSVRVPVADFAPSRSQRRVAARNADLVGSVGPARATSEGYALFRAYLDARHASGGMADMTALDYASMIEEGQVETRLVEYRARGVDSGITGRGEGPLLACSLLDLVEDGLSMVYAFYEPEAAARGLGTHMILDHVARARALGLAHVYLGYWIEGSAKMAYKAGFLPQERLTPRGWERAER